MYKQSINSKFLIQIKFFFICFFITLQSLADDTASQKNLIYIGSNDAKVKIKVFSSFTCPHCADFHLNIVSKIEKEFVKTGEVQIIFIDFPLDQAAFNVSKLLHCLDKNKQMVFMDTIYQTQSEWTNGSNIDDINVNLKKIVKTLGIDSEKFEKCLVDEVISDKILNERIDAMQKYSIESTPTIIINEKKIDGSANFKNIKKKIENII
tara:strand:- start:3405 stop:4028 length:624 start_codon:yes stop_codon:yes gene_type:complete